MLRPARACSKIPGFPAVKKPPLVLRTTPMILYTAASHQQRILGQGPRLASFLDLGSRRRISAEMPPNLLPRCACPGTIHDACLWMLFWRCFRVCVVTSRLCAQAMRGRASISDLERTISAAAPQFAPAHAFATVHDACLWMLRLHCLDVFAFIHCLDCLCFHVCAVTSRL